METGELRLFRVDRRDADTLLPIVVANVAPGTTIMSDECGAYVRLPACTDHGHRMVARRCTMCI